MSESMTSPRHITSEDTSPQDTSAEQNEPISSNHHTIGYPKELNQLVDNNTTYEIPSYFSGVVKAEILHHRTVDFVQFKVVGTDSLEKKITLDLRLMSSLSD